MKMDQATAETLMRAGQTLAELVDHRLENGQLDPNWLFEQWRDKSEEQIRWSLERAPADGKFAEILQQILDDKEEWDEQA